MRRRFNYNVTGQLAGVAYNAENVWTGIPENATRTVDYAYTPDKLNRSSMDDNGDVSTYTPNALNQYENVGGGTVSYDGNFNLTGLGGFWAIYNAANQLVSAQSGEGTAQFVYDGLGRCLKRTVSWETTLIVYDGWKPIVEWNVWEGEAYFKAWNVYGPGADEILWRYADSSGHLRYHSDRHGNIIALLDGAGNGIEKYTYDVFGKPTVTDWSGGDVRYGSWYWNRFQFQGREYFPELGLYDYRNRFYHPILGRFLQTDPTGFDAGDMNLFRYCGDDPVDGSDPTGLVDTSAIRQYSTLTSFNGGDWIKGSDGLSGLDWNDRNSIRPQAGMDGGGAGDRSSAKSIAPENEGWKAPINFVAGVGSYVRGIGRAGESVAGLSGLLGDKRKAEQQQALKDISAAGRLASDHPKATRRLASEALRRNSQNDTSRMGGRMLAGMAANMVIIPVGKVAIPLGAITTPLAAYGDLTHTAISVRRNAETLNASHMLDSIVTGNPRDKDP